MRGFVNRSGAIAVTTAVLAASAPVRAEVNEVRIAVQYGLVYLPVTVAEVEGFFAAQAKKAGLDQIGVRQIPKDEVLGMLADGTMVYSVAPSGLLKFARFMARTGGLKNEPKSWQDVFFPPLAGGSGS